MYFTGEIDQKIDRFKEKMSKKFPDDYYDTTASVELRHDKVASISGNGDPTAYRAIKLADYYLRVKKKYRFFSEIKAIIDDMRVTENITAGDIEIIKKDLALSDKTLEAIYEEFGTTKYQLLKRRRELFNLLLEKLKPVLQKYYH